MQPQESYIPTTWRIKGTVEQVYDVLCKAREFPRWWPVVRSECPVLATKAWMIALAPLLKPLFVWNHKWAMRRGFEGLTRELARRAAA